MSAASRTDRKNVRRVLWVIQAVLAALFLFAGGLKLVLPIAALKGPVALAPLFLRFIGVCEVLGAVGLILPGVLRVLPQLIPLAAAGLVIIMTGATTITLVGGMGVAAIVPFVVGSLAATVAYGRSRVAPITASVAAPSRQVAVRLAQAA
jgi:hypothetical protein